MTHSTPLDIAQRPAVGWGVFNALWPLMAAAMVGLLMLLVVGPAVGGYQSRILTFIGINIILAVSLTIVNGLAGQFSLGHAGFMAIGGYAAAAIVYYVSMRLWGTADAQGGMLSQSGELRSDLPWLAKGDVLFVCGCLCGGVIAAVAGYVVGLPSLRLRGDYLAIVTLGFGEIVRVILQGTKDQIQPWKVAQLDDVSNWELPLMLGGANGFNFLPLYGNLFWIYFATALTLILVFRLKYSTAGREFLSVREDEVAAQAMGVNVTSAKVWAFVIAAFFAGVAGGLYAMSLSAINATELGFQKSIDIVIMVVLGGMGSISGATLAAVLLTIIPELLRDPPALWPIGLALLAILGVRHVLHGRVRLRSFVVVIVATALLEGGRRWAIAADVNLADYRLIIYSLMLILMMLLRPEGLFGVHEIWDVLRPAWRWMRAKSRQQVRGEA
ncbi:MAG: branched-chain amino acid ABC transporter permease [Planctomycetaceae bacterium]